jgi:hypothetical protein
LADHVTPELKPPVPRTDAAEGVQAAETEEIEDIGNDCE